VNGFTSVAGAWIRRSDSAQTPYSDGTTHVIFAPLDFIAKLAALVPKPRVNLTRFHGVFAPNSQYHTEVTPAKRGKGRIHQETEDKTPEQQQQASCLTGV
jgi:hypothetical protein